MSNLNEYLSIYQVSIIVLFTNLFFTAVCITLLIEICTCNTLHSSWDSTVIKKCFQEAFRWYIYKCILCSYFVRHRRHSLVLRLVAVLIQSSPDWKTDCTDDASCHIDEPKKQVNQHWKINLSIFVVLIHSPMPFHLFSNEKLTTWV